MKIQIFKKTLIAFLSLLFLSALSIALIRVIPVHAEPLSITINVVADADGAYNGSVTVGGQTTSDDNGHKITAEVSPSGSLEISATAAENYLFQCWATDTTGQTTAVSVKSADTFTYEECQNFAATELYAIFVSELPEEYAEAQKLKINYNSELGDIYMFFGKPAPTNDDLVSHGIQVNADSKYIIPYTTEIKRETRYISYNFLLAAVPKSEVVSKLNGENTTARFMGWKAVYQKVEEISYGNPTGSGYYEEPTSMVPYCDRISGSSSGGDGSFTGSANKSEELGAEWFASRLQASKDSVQWYATDRNDMEYWYFKNVKPGYANYLYVKPQSLVAEFEEVAAVPEVTVTPVVDGAEKPVVISKTLQTTVDMPYGGENNSVRVKIAGLPFAEKQDYTISVQKERNLEDKGYVLDDSVTCEEMGGDYLFTVSDITVNSNIIITRDYGGEYYTEPLTIFVRFKTEEGLKDLIASDSANIEVINDNGEDWYFDPQFNGGGKLSYTSGISYPEEVTDKSKQSISQLHFKVKGSGVFTFEFYLDGLDGFGKSLAAYKFGSAFDESDFKYDSIPYNSQAKQLAKGYGYLFTGFEYRECEMTEQNGVARLSGNKGWCSATIQVSGKQDEEYTDVYIVHATSDSSCSLSSVIEWYKAHAVMSVRNVAFYQGQSNVSWGIYGNDEEGSKDGYGKITATVNGEEQSAQPYLSESGAKITFKVTPEETYKFYGWSDGENLLSTELEFTYTVHGKKGDEISQTNISAVITPADEASTYAYQNGGKFYAEDKLQQALNGITTNPQVFVLKSVEVSGEITVPKGAELILPFNEKGDFYKDGTEGTAGTTFSWKNSKYSTPFRTFTFTGTMTLNGTFRIGAVVNYPGQSYSGLTSGAYTQFINNGSVIVKNGGYADVYGLVTGSGSFKVEALGKMAQPFLILDFSGGSNTYALYSQNQTPFNRYAMVNVQCTGGITVEYMGELLGHASLYAVGSINTASAPVISYKTGDNDESVRGLITLTSGGSVKIEYKEEEGVISTAANGTQWIGKTTVTFYGGATANHMSLNVGFTISTEDVKAFAVPYNFEIILEEGTFAVDGNFKFMPGSSLNVKHGATLNVNNTLYIYDGLVQSGMSGKTYPTAEQLKKAGYKTNATFIVDGKLNINSTATFLGVVQTNGTGEIITSSGATLSGTIEEGGLGGYDCNYMEYKSSARVWDSAHGENGEMRMLEAGKTYNGVVCDNWTLPAITLKYDKKNYGGVESSHVDHATSPEFIEASTDPVDGLKGSWTVDGHSEHTYDWTTLTEDESGADAENPVKTLTHKCTEIGCTQTEQKTLLYLPETFSVDYKGSEYSIDDIKSVLFGKHSGFETTNVTVVLDGGDFTVQRAYTAKLTLADGYFFLDGKTLITEKTINWNIQQYELTEANVKITESPENIIYNGTEWQPTYTVTWDNETAINLNSDYSVRWENNTNASEEAKLIITGIGQFKGEVTITFTIKPKDITVTITTPQPTTYTGELQKFEHVDQDGNDLSKYTIGKGLYGSDKLQITLTAEGTDAGDYPIRGVSANTNYNVTFTPANYTIKPAPVTFSLEKDSYEYTGEQIKPGVKAVWGGSETLDAGEYSIAYGENTNVKGTNNVVITITGKNFTVTEGEKTKTLEFGITPKSIVGAKVEVAGSYTYTGEAITPTTDKITVTLKDWNKEITFKVSSYSNNTNASAVAQVTVEGTGNYEGTATGNFTIVPKSIDGATVTVTTPVQEIIYKNEQWQPAFTVTVTGIDGNLAVDTDYTVQYGENKTVKEGGTITVNGTGNFTGTATQTFEIKSKDVTVTVIGGNIAYGEEPKTPYEVNIVGLLNDVTEDSLKAMLDYTLTKPQDLSVGNEYKVEVKFKEGESLDNYTVKFTPGTFTIVDKEYSEIKFAGATNVTYDGKAHALTLTGLPDGASYKLTYTKGGSGSENAPQDVGEYTVTAVVTLTNGATYDKLQSATLTITPAPVTFSLEKDSYEYTGEQIKPEVTAKWVAEGANTLEQSGNFTVEYGENTNVKGTNNVKITLTNTNFIGDTTLTFEITAKSISGATVEVAGSYTYTGSKIQPGKENITVTLTGWEHDITFSVTYGENIHVKDNGTVTVTGTGNYTGTATGNFTIAPKSIDGATVTVTTPAQEIIYKNAQWQPAITVKVNGITNALTGNDYNVSYGQNTNVGEGTISVEGKGNFTGTAETTFTILQKGVQITLKAQTAVYDGTEQSVSSDSAYWEATGVIAGDDLQVELQGSRKDVGPAAIKVKSINANYKIENGEPTGTFTVTAKSITVKIKDQSAEYTNSVPTVDQSNEAWESEGVCGTDDLHITITKAPGVQAGGYELTGGYSNPNYTVKFVNEDGEEKSATFTITKKAVTVTIADKSSVYGDELAELTYTYSGSIAGDGFDIKDYVSLTTDAERYSAVSGSYKITAEIKEAINYTISAADAEYTLTARPVKYTITNQSSVYSGAVPEVEQKYSITEGEVVNGDSVGITVKAAGITKDVGKYEITGEWSNKNYAVEFVPGEYEITKLDISGNITISVNDETDIDENDTLKVQYAGESLAVSGMAYSEISGDEELEITVVTDMTEITGIGNYTVKATINDKNYAGEKSFTVIVSDENGYTANLYSVLEELEELGKGINPDDYKEGDFEKLKAIQKAISGLTAEERAVASEELAEYEQLIEAWNNGVEVDGEVVETAKAIADAPVSALIVAASVSAIAALAYVIGKGGRII